MNYSVQVINKKNESDNGVYEFESEEMANQFVQDCVAHYTFLPKQMGYAYTHTDSAKTFQSGQDLLSCLSA